MDLRAEIDPTLDALQEFADLPDMQPHADVISCLMVAFVGCLPSMITAFTACMLGKSPNPGGGKYDPGTRTRCP